MSKTCTLQVRPVVGAGVAGAIRHARSAQKQSWAAALLTNQGYASEIKPEFMSLPWLFPT